MAGAADGAGARGVRASLHLRALWARLRGFWPEALLAALLALPWLALFALGFWWLWENGAVLHWAVASALLALAGLPLRRLVRRRTADRAAALLGPEAFPEQGWNAEEAAAWEKVVALAEATPALDWDERERGEALLRETVEMVAREFHPGREDAAARVTLPEALLLAETVSRRLRAWVLGHMPGARSVKLSHLLTAQRFMDRHGETAMAVWRVGEGLWRASRFARNPIAAVAQEANRALAGNTTDFLAGNIRRAATRQAVLETGRAAIELYGGRLRLSAREAREAARAESGEPDAPLRLLLVGQPNAGKTSLLNALAGSLRAEASPLPGEGALREHLVTAPGRPSLVVADLPATEAEATRREAARADLVLWVVGATRPDRAADLAGLRALRDWAAGQSQRRAPPLAVALTGVDQLRPAHDWAPPYEPGHPKARSIAAAREAVAAALDVAPEEVVPVALPPGEPPWNVEALWDKLASGLDAARHARFERLREGAARFDAGEAAGQAMAAAKWALRAVFDRR